MPCQVGRHKGVNRVFEERIVPMSSLADRGNRRPSERLERPMLGAGGTHARPDRPARSLPDRSNAESRKPRPCSVGCPSGGMRIVASTAGDSLHQVALAALAGNDVHAVLAAAERRLAPVETQAALLLFFAVAGKAARSRESAAHRARSRPGFSEAAAGRSAARERAAGREPSKMRSAAAQPHVIPPTRPIAFHPAFAAQHRIMADRTWQAQGASGGSSAGNPL